MKKVAKGNKRKGRKFCLCEVFGIVGCKNDNDPFRKDGWDDSMKQMNGKYTGREPHFGLISNVNMAEWTLGMYMAFSTRKLQS